MLRLSRITAGTVAGLLALTLAACGSSGTGPAPGTGETTDAGTEPVSQDDATDDTASIPTSTELSGGTYTTTVDGTEITYRAAYLVDGIDAVIDGGTYASASADEAVILVVHGGSLTVTHATVVEDGEAQSTGPAHTRGVSDDAPYGRSSAIVVVGEGSSVTVADSEIITTSDGADAIVAMDAGTADVTDTTVTTSGNSSRGLRAVDEGVITGEDLTITTSGEDSPLLHSAGTMSVDGLSGAASASPAIVVDGRSTARLTNAEVTAAGSDALMVYRATPGEAAGTGAIGPTTRIADTGAGSVTIEDTTITYTGDGPVFHFTNTDADLTLTNVIAETETPVLASAQAGLPGQDGSGEAEVMWTVSGSSLSGSVEAEAGSAIEVRLVDGASMDVSTHGSVSIAEI